MATASIVDEMDSAAEPARADEPPSGKLSPLPVETKVEGTDESFLTRPRSESEVEMAVPPATQTRVQEGPAECLRLPEEKAEVSPQDRPASVHRTTPSLVESPSPLNGNHQEPNERGGTANGEGNKQHNKQKDNGDNEDNNEELSPPPDSPVADTMSRTSSVPPAALHDEIVVGTKAHTKSSPTQAAEPEDVVMGETEDKPMINQHPKRKRASGIYAESVGDKDDSSAPTQDLDMRRATRPATKAHGLGGVKGVLLGYWRDSPAGNDADKHAVIGFIDIRDRLRTRIQPTTRDGRPMDQRYPIPPGPGGSWVTFDKVAFDAHLVSLNHHVVKEYVKIRANDSRRNETPEEASKRDLEAAELAAERIRTNPPPEAATAPLVAYGPELPANAVVPNRPETKKRRLAGSFGVHSDSPSAPQHLLDNIPGTRPTRILLGYWKLSSEEDPINKHAVFGILGANDMFRVKLTRETRDGRTVIGNFPSGAGALWIHWDEVEFDPHLKHLTRPEIKEYCRVRQRQLDLGELSEERVANETKAVYEAQQRVAHSIALGIPFRKDDVDLPPIAMRGSPMANGNGHEADSPNSSFIAPKPAEEPRHSRRTDGLPRTTATGRRSLPDVEFRATNRQLAGPSSSAVERTNSIANRAIARLEAAQARADMRAASREMSLGPAAAAATAAAAGLSSSSNNNNNNNDNDDNNNTTAIITSGTSTPDTSRFQDNVSRLNKVWEAQEANRIRAGGEDAKIYMGVKYQRKQSGPFQGKLVSQGMIITIDGEDYVEYRVLTKPTFF